ncbi:unnamed protein product, partial [Phaeothamnion confervicola]
MMSILNIVILFASSFVGGDCAFVIHCKELVRNVRADPILTPGTLAEHRHTFFGSNAISAFTATGEQLIAGTCTTCTGDDYSGYWVPTLSWQSTTTHQEVVEVARFHAYWSNTFRGTGTFAPITLMPLGLRFVVGEEDATTDAMSAPFYTWSCASDLNKGSKHWPSMCKGFMRLSLNFPECWNGKDLYLPGSKHMTFADGAGVCPRGFVRTWAIRMEIDYNVKPEWVWNPPKFLLGNKKHSSSFGIHADFFNGLTIANQQDYMNRCGN